MPGLDLALAALTLAVALAAVIWGGIVLHIITTRGRRRSTIKES